MDASTLFRLVVPGLVMLGALTIHEDTEGLACGFAVMMLLDNAYV